MSLRLDPPLDPLPQRVHDSEPKHPESCGCHWCTPKGVVYRKVDGIPFEEVRVDPRALTMAADAYEAFTGHVDEVALGHAILCYLESEAS